MLLNRITTHFESSVRERNLLSEVDIEKMTYGLHVILSEGIKLIIYFVFFSTIHHLLEFSFAVLLLVSIRSHSGGLHFYTWLKCFIFSLGFFILVVLVLPNMIWINQNSIYFFLSIFSILITLLFAPKPSKFRPLSNKRLRLKSKLLALASTLIWLLILILVFHPSKLFSIGIWTITLQNTQLLLSGGIKNEKND